MTTFAESRINDIVDYLLGTVGGCEFQTNIVVVQSGYEQRNQNWSVARGQWQLGERNITDTERAALESFFRARAGMFQGFRFKNWADYTATTSNGNLDLGIGTGLPTQQMFKRYSDGGVNYDRQIYKPVSGTIQIVKNGSVMSTGYSIDYTTGIVTFTGSVAGGSITGITNASNGVVTTSLAHGLTTNTVIYLTGIAGTLGSNLNNKTYTITVVDSTHFSLNVNTTSLGTYTSGGVVNVYNQPADQMNWAGQFDTPVRFDVDQLQYKLDEIINGQPYFYLMSLPIVEIRL